MSKLWGEAKRKRHAGLDPEYLLYAALYLHRLVPPERLQSTVVKWHTQATCWVSDSPFGMGVRAVVSSFTTLPTGPAGTHALIPVAR